MEAEGEKAKGLSKREVAGATGPRNTGGAAPWGPVEEFGWDLGCPSSGAVVFTGTGQETLQIADAATGSQGALRV